MRRLCLESAVSTKYIDVLRLISGCAGRASTFVARPWSCFVRAERFYRSRSCRIYVSSGKGAHKRLYKKSLREEEGVLIISLQKYNISAGARPCIVDIDLLFGLLSPLRVDWKLFFLSLIAFIEWQALIRVWSLTAMSNGSKTTLYTTWTSVSVCWLHYASTE